MSRLPGTFCVCSVSIALSLLLAGGTQSSSAQPTSPDPAALVEVSLMGSPDQVVVGLVGNQMLTGEVREISVAPFRIFVDFVNVVSEVAAVTVVETGAVNRVRVGLNQAEPPTTRVVLDLAYRAPYRVEKDSANNEFRIIVGSQTSSSTKRADDSQHAADLPAFSALSSPVVEYAGWFTALATDIDRLLSPDTIRPETGASSETVALEWQRLRYELGMVTPPVSLQTAHDLLATAIQLGDASTGTELDDRTPQRDRTTARAGAALLVTRARDLVEAELAKTDSEQ